MLTLQGLWYLVATTEPTTRFCLCNVMDYSIYTTQYRCVPTQNQLEHVAPFNTMKPRVLQNGVINTTVP